MVGDGIDRRRPEDAAGELLGGAVTADLGRDPHQRHPGEHAEPPGGQRPRATAGHEQADHGGDRADDRQHDDQAVEHVEQVAEALDARARR